MQYIIFDLEWNQPASEDLAVTDPLYLSGEVIQIGAVKLNEQFEPIDELRLYIRPTYYAKLHKRIAALTGIRDKELQEQGLPFPHAYTQFLDWCGTEYAFMTWSMSDLPVLIDNLNLHRMDCSQLPDCYDIQRIFCREVLRSSLRCSLDSALATLHLQGDPAHDALHDARNTAKICAQLDLEQYLGEYTSRVFPLSPSQKDYDSIRSALHDESLTDISCPWCGAQCQCEGWVNLDASSFINYGYCTQEDDEFLLWIGLHKRHNGSYRISRLLYEMSDDFWEIYQDRREAQQSQSTTPSLRP